MLIFCIVKKYELIHQRNSVQSILNFKDKSKKNDF